MYTSWVDIYAQIVNKNTFRTWVGWVVLRSITTIYHKHITTTSPLTHHHTSSHYVCVHVCFPFSSPLYKVAFPLLMCKHCVPSIIERLGIKKLLSLTIIARYIKCISYKYMRERRQLLPFPAFIRTPGYSFHMTYMYWQLSLHEMFLNGYHTYSIAR